MEELTNLRTETGKMFDAGKDKTGRPSYTLEARTGPIHFKDAYKDTDPWLDLDESYCEPGEIKGIGRVLVYPKLPNIVTVFQDRCGYQIQSRSNPDHVARVELVSIDGLPVTNWQDSAALKTSVRVHPYRVGIWKDFSGASKGKATTMRWKVTELGNNGKDSHQFFFRETPEAYNTADLTAPDSVSMEQAKVVVETARTRIDDSSWYWDELIPANAKLVDTDWQVGAKQRNADVRMRPSLGGWNMVSFDAPTVWAGWNLSDLYAGGCGLGFTGISAGKGSTIITAFLTLTAYSAYSNNDVNTRITGHLASNSPEFDDLADYQARRGTAVGGANNNNRTKAQVTWDKVSAMVGDSEYESPSIVSVIQEIINQATWVSGNALSLFWDDHENRSTNISYTYRNMYSYTGSSSKAPKLTITWTETMTVFPYYYNNMRP